MQVRLRVTSASLVLDGADNSQVNFRTEHAIQL